ncbi:MAG: VWA domain-containing protein, partial [Acidobacteriota bacterium]|nr:VWA domain-containing protein [Acidobacteriota bacterium]
VSVPLTVRDKKGALVSGLAPESLVLQVDRKPLPIRSLAHDNETPLTVGLVVDASMGQRDALEDERTAARAFFDDLLNASSRGGRDQAFVVQFARQADLLQDVTASKPRIDAAIQQLQTVAGSKGGASDSTSGVDPGNGRSSGERGGNTLYDAVFLSSDEVLARHPGRKAIVLLSDGDDRGSKESVTSAIEAAQRAGVVLYAIYFKGRQDRGSFPRAQIGQDDGGYPGGGYPGGGYPGGGYPGGGYPGGGYPGGGYPGGGYPGDSRGPGGSSSNPPQPNGRKVLEHMAKETGGRIFDLNRKGALTGIYTQIAEELRAQYRLTFAPDKPALAEGFHTIDLTLSLPNAKDYAIQTPEGYYPSE